MDNPICQLWGTMGPSMSTMLPPDVMGRATFCGRCKWCCVQDPVRSTGNAYSKVVHWGRRWKHLGKAHADWFKEPCSGGPDEGMPEETPMEWGILASDVNNNALPTIARGKEKYPQIQRKPFLGQWFPWCPGGNPSTTAAPGGIQASSEEQKYSPEIQRLCYELKHLHLA